MFAEEVDYHVCGGLPSFFVCVNPIRYKLKSNNNVVSAIATMVVKGLFLII